MQRVAVRILHPPPGDHAGELTRLVTSARRIAADELVERFRAAGAEDVGIVTGAAGKRPFGQRLREVVGEAGGGCGLVVLGSGSIPLARDEDVALLIGVARSGERHALTNNRFSSDVIAIGRAAILGGVPDLAADNALPRWLATVAGVAVAELPDRARLGLDIDSPLDLELLRRHAHCPPRLADLALSVAALLARAVEALDELAAIARDPRKELLLSGRLSATTLREVEEGTACRIRAFVEERGLRASAALDGDGQRPPSSALGLLLDHDGPGAIGTLVGRLADGAIIDSRVLLAHRHGPDEAAWPSPEDRFASDLLLVDRVDDPWLRELTDGASEGAVPIALGGHSLIGPGLRLALAIPA